MEVSESTKKIVPWIVACALFMEMLDSTIVTTAIPHMAYDFGLNVVSLKVAITSYLLSLAIFIPISGWIGDRFGTQRVFAFAFCLFTIGSIFCGVSMNLYELVASRILQGVGGALMMPIGRLVLLQTFPKTELLKATNYVTIPSLLGPILGPVVGGALTTYLSWHWIFYINIPVGILGVYLTLQYLPNFIKPEVPKLDVVGFLLFGFALAGISFGFEVVGEHTLSPLFNTLEIMLSLSVLAMYFIYSRNSEHPVLNLTVFQNLTFRRAVFGNILSRLLLGGMPFILPLLFQVALGQTPFMSGVLIVPMMVGALLMKLLQTRMARSFGFRKILITNSLLLSGIVLLFLEISSIDYPLIIGLTFILGFFSSLQFSNMNVLAYTALDMEQMSAGTSIVSTVQQLFNALGIALCALFLEGFTETAGFHQPTHMAAYHATFICLAVFPLLAGLVFYRLQPNDGSEASGYLQERRDRQGARNQP